MRRDYRVFAALLTTCVATSAILGAALRDNDLMDLTYGLQKCQIKLAEQPFVIKKAELAEASAKGSYQGIQQLLALNPGADSVEDLQYAKMKWDVARFDVEVQQHELAALESEQRWWKMRSWQLKAKDSKRMASPTMRTSQENSALVEQSYRALWGARSKAAFAEVSAAESRLEYAQAHLLRAQKLYSAGALSPDEYSNSVDLYANAKVSLAQAQAKASQMASLVKP